MPSLPPTDRHRPIPLISKSTPKVVSCKHLWVLALHLTLSSVPASVCVLPLGTRNHAVTRLGFRNHAVHDYTQPICVSGSSIAPSYQLSASVTTG